ncbi:hypothetical protein CJF42_04465 [Pseudoalteromonas sp. NBT06-2]|uniref:DUF3019 domain-containing protein n=1 Tax=Pseudoalteromonas sp. NBT06-2 TaxID=2025950 RepID=UPI000BA747F1|nr:DUF3019 domain-containing protein [Pseudoalteromonas sp. NBT06-2]PAJ75579.1 hypothetical protein CJF42_04465 [Pseudoalteromonas sp. NBT06-2]
MYFRSINYLYLLTALLPFKTLAEVNLNEIDHFAVTPNKCIALRKGRPCYAIVSVNWKKLNIGNYCLRNSKSKQIMQCWTAQNAGIYQYEFNSEKNQSFELVNTKTGHVSGKAGIKVHWVYTNKQKKRRWRLF